MRKTLMTLVLAALAGASLAMLTAPAFAQAFQSQAPIAFLIDTQSGAVLYEKAPDEPVALASSSRSSSCGPRASGPSSMSSTRCWRPGKCRTASGKP